MKIDLGCGTLLRDGYVGVDIVPAPNVQYVVNLDTDELPFEDRSVDAVFSSHAFEHLEWPQHLLHELQRVCKPGAQLEIWLPYGHSNDAFLCGHRQFYNELHFQHMFLEAVDAWTPNALQFFRWDRLRYNLKSGVYEAMHLRGFPIDFALRHLNNVAWEFGLFLTMQAGRWSIPPITEVAYGRSGPPLEVLS